MKKINCFLALAALVSACILVSCDNDPEGNGNGNEPPVDTDVAVTGVTLDHSTLTLTEGDTETLQAAVAPADATNQKISWTTGNGAVATVADGVVMAVAEGTATITVTTDEGKFIDECVVTVNAAAIAVSEITLNKTAVWLAPTETLELSATVLPTDATNPAVTWRSSDNSVAMVVSNGTVTAMGDGTATITATAADGSEVKAECGITVNMIGNVSFLTDKTWTVGGQIWSDVIITSGCHSKTDYNGGDFTSITGTVITNTPLCDCRHANVVVNDEVTEEFGDLFSWKAVSDFKEQLCPAPWRVPTKQDFIDLDVAMGGAGTSPQMVMDATVLAKLAKYVSAETGGWGGVVQRYLTSSGYVGTLAANTPLVYWSQTEGSDNTRGTNFNMVYATTIAMVFYPSFDAAKANGFPVRCVKGAE